MGSKTLNCLWTVVLVLLCIKMTLSEGPPKYRTKACDGKMLKLECKENEVINVIRAIYGRYSITVCNDNGTTDWSVNCMSSKSLPILQAHCNLKQNCSIEASTSLFDDPCPGTVKYLEAHYDCVSATISLSTSRVNPQWSITSPVIWMTPKSFPIYTEASTAPSHTTSAASSSSSSVTLEDVQDIDLASPDMPSPSVESETSIPLVTGKNTTEISIPTPSHDDKEPMCRATVIRDLTWNWKSSGEVEVQQCPDGATGLARWRCIRMSNNSAIWFPDTPDLSGCQSVWLNELKSRIGKDKSLLKIAEDLSQVTESKALFGGDLLVTVKMIRDLAHKMRIDIRTFSDYRQREAAVDSLLQFVSKVSSNLLDMSQHASWKDLSHKEQMQVASSLLIGLEETSFLLAETKTREKVVPHCHKNILLSVRILEMENVHDEHFPPYSLPNDCSFRVDDWLQLHKSSLLENEDAGLVRLVYTAFDTLHQVLKVPPNGKVEKVINSKVISASLGEDRHIQLTQPVTLCLQHLLLENVSNPTCVFWDYTQNQWSDEGCSLITTNKTHTICRCSRLTNFAIMADMQPMILDPSDHSISTLTLLLAVLVLSVLLVSASLALCYQYKKRSRKVYSSAVFAPGNSKWFHKCFSCCQASSKSDKTYSCKEPRPSLYGNATVQSMASVVDNSGTIRTTHVIPHTSSTMPRSYMVESAIEGHYPTSHLRFSQHYPTCSRSSSSRRVREARRLEHLENTLQHRNKKLSAGSPGSHSPRSHTYSEIAAASYRSDPVYEEIDRDREHYSQVSDVSDEEARRISDTSRQSSKSYGDHRPLIPYNAAVTDRNFHAALDAAYRQQLMEHNAKTVSVLDGQTVVCHLQQSDPRLYQKSMGHPPYHY